MNTAAETDHRTMTDDCPRSRAHRPSTIAVLVLFCAATLIGQTSDRARTESQARRVSERLQALQREADTLASEQRTLLGDLRRLEVERDLRSEQLKEIEGDAQKVGFELGNTGNQIAELEEKIEASRPILEARMVELYKLGSAGYARLLFNVTDLKEVGRAYRMVAAVAAIDRRRAEEHQQTLLRLRAAYRSLEDRQKTMTKLERAASAARIAAERAATARAQLISNIDRRRDLTAELAGELQAAQQKLQQSLAAFNSGAPRAAADETPLPIRPFRGDLDWPVSGRMLTPFGRGGGSVSAPALTGVQFAADEGVPVHAVHDGTVLFTGPFTGYGNLVIVDHGTQTYSLYGQLGASQVERGAKIERGNIVGTTGRILAGVPGMYFEMRVDGKPVDPLEWLKKKP